MFRTHISSVVDATQGASVGAPKISGTPKPFLVSSRVCFVIRSRGGRLDYAQAST
jgi:hypothetical protein